MKLAVFSALSLLIATPAIADPSMRVIATSGQVWVTPQGRNLLPGYRFSTGGGSSMAVDFAGLAIANVYGGSSARVSGLGVVGGGGWGYTVDLSKGSLRWASRRSFNNKNSYVLVRTPSGVLSVRGTNFFTETRDWGSYVAVLQGTVNYCHHATYRDCDDPYTQNGVKINPKETLEIKNDGTITKGVIASVEADNGDGTVSLKMARNIRLANLNPNAVPWPGSVEFLFPGVEPGDGVRAEIN